MAQKFNGDVVVDGTITASNVATDNNAQIASKAPMQFVDASGAINYIGMDVGTLAISSGTHVFTSCIGNVQLSGNTAKVSANNSPNLRINSSSLRCGMITIGNIEQAQDYHKWVMPIVKYSGVSATEFASFNLTCIRRTGTYPPILIAASLQRKYGQDDFFREITGGNNGVLDSCTFTMGGEKYVGFGYKANPSPHYLFAEGVYNSSSDKVFGLYTYYNNETNQVIDAEIHNSLVWI